MTVAQWEKQVRRHMALFFTTCPGCMTARTQADWNQEAMKVMPHLFKSLDRVGLIPKGFTYEEFYKAAYQRFMQSRGIKA